MTTDRSPAELLAMTEAQLYAALGAELLGTGQGFGLEDISRARRYAKSWLEEQSNDLQKKVCGSTSVKRLLEQESTDLAANVITVTAVLESPLRSHAVASIVAVFVARRGLGNYCGVD